MFTLLMPRDIDIPGWVAVPGCAVAGFLKGTAEPGFYLIWADPRSDLAG